MTMNNHPLRRPLSAIFSQLSIGVSRTSIRLGSTRKRWKRPRPDLTGFEPGWGEKIWVWRHIHTNQIVYSHGEQMRSTKALAQLPFIAKKTKPPKLRKDYWHRMCLISLGAGREVIGRCVFQKLRELRHLHEVSWGDELFQGPEGMRTRLERAQAICDQHANSVADLAAVLSGAGPANKMWIEKKKQGGADGPKKELLLLPVKIFWDNDMDLEFAEKWSENVEHRLLTELDLPTVEKKKTVEAKSLPPKKTDRVKTEPRKPDRVKTDPRKPDRARTEPRKPGPQTVVSWAEIRRAGF